MNHRRPGLLALVIVPDGTTRTERLPGSPARAAAELTVIVGGPLEAILGPDWCAYLDEEGHRHNAPINYLADTLARQLGWRAHPGTFLAGPVAFLGRSGADETDVPPAVLRMAALIDQAGQLMTVVMDDPAHPDTRARITALADIAETAAEETP